MFCEECQNGGDAAGPERHCFIIYEDQAGRWRIKNEMSTISGHNHAIEHLRRPPVLSADELGQRCTDTILSRLETLRQSPGVAALAHAYLQHINCLMDLGIR